MIKIGMISKNWQTLWYDESDGSHGMYITEVAYPSIQCKYIDVNAWHSECSPDISSNQEIQDFIIAVEAEANSMESDLKNPS